ncbi:hypothetical protein ABFX02_05G098400 [Erythranthe guttata]
MAPKKKAEAAAAAVRVTRSATKSGAAELSEKVDNPQPRKRKAPEAASASVGNSDQRKKKKAKTTTSASPSAAGNSEKGKKKMAKTPTTGGGAASSSAGAKTVIIEHCKESKSFKTKAKQVKKGLEKEIPGVSVVVNPDPPRKGFFEIRDEDGEVYLSLNDMKNALNALDADELVSDIVGKIR